MTQDQGQILADGPDSGTQRLEEQLQCGASQPVRDLIHHTGPVDHRALSVASANPQNQEADHDAELAKDHEHGKEYRVASDGNSGFSEFFGVFSIEYL